MSSLEPSLAALPRLSEAAPAALAHAKVELGFSPETIAKYEEALRHVARMVGDLPIVDYGKQHVLALKTAMLGRNHSVGRQICLLAAFKRVLIYCQKERELPVMDPQLVQLPRRPRRDVAYLTPAEVESFVAAIEMRNQDGKPSEAGFRFRALVECLLGSAMRISEALSLNRADVDFDGREARVIGKGNKQRTVFFTARAVFWLRRYLEVRQDSFPALFATQGGRSRLGRPDIWRPFTRYRKMTGIQKRVTPHLLRHTAATQLLFNGCPVGHIKEILGHERLETTCRYYLGLDRRAAKQAHQKYLVYAAADPALT